MQNNDLVRNHTLAEERLKKLQEDSQGAQKALQNKFSEKERRLVEELKTKEGEERSLKERLREREEELFKAKTGQEKMMALYEQKAEMVEE